MNNPFTSIEEDRRSEVVKTWLTAGAIENTPSGWDLTSYENEWDVYTVGQIRRLAELARVEFPPPAIDLTTLLTSRTVVETMDLEWISKVRSLDEVYVGLIREFLNNP